ncbi:MAG: SCO family protein [Alphaproteobacteria bacterium]|nr:SCO family protein [Alphaproteobacteria bacterium]
MQRRFVFPVLAIVLLLAGSLTWSAFQRLSEPPAVTSPIPVGGAFALVNHLGRTVTDADFRDRHLLVFFGYVFCPDVCPTAMSTITDALEWLGSLGAKIQPLFISVDPDRDTPEVLNSFVENFHPSIVGLTGSPEQIAKVAKGYHAYFMKVLEGEEGEEPDEDYLMYHTSNLYMMAPGGKFLARFRHDISPDELAAGLRKHM